MFKKKNSKKNRKFQKAQVLKKPRIQKFQNLKEETNGKKLQDSHFSDVPTILVGIVSSIEFQPILRLQKFLKIIKVTKTQKLQKSAKKPREFKKQYIYISRVLMIQEFQFF